MTSNPVGIGQKRAASESLENTSHKKAKFRETQSVQSLVDFTPYQRLISGINGVFLSQLPHVVKVTQLISLIQQNTPLFILQMNPCLGYQMGVITQRCLALAPEEREFQAFDENAATLRLPEELMEKIHNSLSVALKDFISAPAGQLGLLSGVGSASKSLRTLTLGLFAKALSTPSFYCPREKRGLHHFKIDGIEDLITLSRICRGKLTSICLQIFYKEIPRKRVTVNEEALKLLLEQGSFNLDYLNLSYTHIQGDALTQHANALKRLKTLKLQKCSKFQMSCLAKVNLPALEALDITGVGGERNTLNLFASSPWRANLKKFMTSMTLGPQEIGSVLLTFPNLSSLGGKFTDSGITTLAVSPQSQTLKGVTIRNLALPASALSTLFFSPFLNLEVMNLKGGCKIGLDAPLFEQSPSRALRCIRGLSLEHFSDAVLLNWFRSESLKNLTELGLQKAKISHLKILNQATFIFTLETLTVGSGNLLDRGFLFLEKEGNCGNLKYLNVKSCRITESTLLTIAKSPRFENLTAMDYGASPEAKLRIDEALRRKRSSLS